MGRIIRFPPLASDPSRTLRHARERSGLTHTQFAARIGQAIGRPHLFHATIRAWETGTCQPPPEIIQAAEAIATQAAEERPKQQPPYTTRTGHFVEAPESPAADRLLPHNPAAPSSAGLDSSYVETLHTRIRELVGLDLHFGGDSTSGMALDLFRSVHRKLGTNECDPHTERDLYAAAAELAEVAGWLLYDAGKHALVRQINQEALHLSRLAGDHSIELLTLQNISMHAGDLGRPIEALRIARMVLDTNTLSPRLEALFRTREARALAQAGDQTAALRAYAKARALYFDGVDDNDPPWAWWINDQELAWHQAMIQAESADWRAAADTFQTSIELTPAREVRRRYSHLASLLDAQIRVAAWNDADQTVRRIMPFMDEVHSTRTATILLDALDQLGTKQPTPSMRDAASQLKSMLTTAGFSGA